MNRPHKPRSVKATPEGILKLKKAQDALTDKQGKFTYERINEKTGISAKTVGRFFQGQDIDKSNAKTIAQVLNLDITEIVDPKHLNPPTPTTTPTEINWRKICNQVLETQHLRRQVTRQQYELNIYVPLGLMERPKTPNPRKNATGEESPPQKEPELQIVQTYKDDAFFLKVIAENHTEKGKHIAIIGEPGAGKTTLLGELAERLAKNSPDFPICIRLADLRDSTIADYLLNNWLAKALQFIDFEEENVTPEIRKSFKQLFAAGKVWLLLDGVDEMAATSPIEALARIQEQLTDWVGKARVVLTCRLNVWDAAISNTLTDFDTYKTLEFEPDDVDEFIRQWFEEASQDEKRRNSGNETFWREQGKRLTRQLKEPGKERIKELVRNPLRLSMLCQSWCVPEQELPETKAALYEQFTTYFFEWKQEEFSKKQRGLNQRDKKQIQQALAKLALAAMESVNRFRIEQDFAIEQMEEEWFNLADELGWLVLVDRDTRTKKPVYAFFHPTFQEYFAACAIEDWHYFLLHQIPPVSDCSYRIFEKQWREVILLWLGRGEIEGKQKEEFIDALVNFEDGCGEWGNLYVNKNDYFSGERNFLKVDRACYEYRAYFLASAAIAEFQNYSQIDEVIEQIVKWGFGYFDSEKQEWVKFSYAISNAAEEALQQTQRPKAINTLVQLLKSDQLGDDTRRQAAESLGNIGQGNQKAIDALVQLLSSDQLSDYTCRQVAESLGNIDPGNQNAIDTLVQLLSSDQLSNYTRREVAESLGNIGQGNQKAIDALVQLLGSPQLDDDTRREVAESLGNIDPGNQKAIDALVQLLSSPQLDDYYTRREVVYSLSEIGQGNQKAINDLVQLLDSPQLYDDTRWRVAESLGNIDPGNQKAINDLVQLLSSDQLSDYTCREVAESLEKIDPGNQKAIDALVQLLGSPHLADNTRREVAESLEKIDPGNQKAIDALVQLLIFHQLDYYTCRQVVEILEKIGQGNQKAIDALVQLLISHQLDYSTREKVVEILEKIDPGNQNAINGLVQLLSSPQLDDRTRRQVAESLGKIDPGNQTAIDALVQLLSSPHLDDYTRRQVAESLGKIDPGNQKAIDALVQLLNLPNLYNYTRRQVVEILGKIGQGNQTAIDILIQLLNYPNLSDYTRREVAESLGKIDSGNQKAIDALVQLLSSPHLADNTRRRVADSLEKIGQGNQKAIDTLVQLLKSDQLDDFTRRLVVVSLGKIGQGNQKAIDTLVQLLSSPNLDSDTRRKVAESLGKIGPDNQKAIDALLQLLGSPDLDSDTRRKVAESLGKISPDNQKAIDALVKLLISPHLDYDTRRRVAQSLKEIQTDKQFTVIKTLKANFNNSQQINKEYYELIWHYAQNLPYPDFYQAWHQDTLTNTATANLNIANLPQVLAEAINNQPELCSKVKLICIDTHQFIDPENPAPEIYDLMLNQKCPEWQNGYPETMQKLKLYWNYLRRHSENPLFFICYDSTALTATPTGFSLPFLTALSKFDGAICVVWEKGEFGLQTFSPSQPDLVSNIVKWIETKIL